MHDGYVVVGRRDEIGPGASKRVVANGTPVTIANVGGTVYAVDDRCTHEDSSLSLDCLKGELVSCSLHGSRFSVITGEPHKEPATGALCAWAVRIENDNILVRAGTR